MHARTYMKNAHSTFLRYARGVGASLNAAAVLSVVPKSAVAFPQSWKTAGWPCGSGDGVLVQLEVGGWRWVVWVVVWGLQLWDVSSLAVGVWRREFDTEGTNRDLLALPTHHHTH